jgi:hypothetical protein
MKSKLIPIVLTCVCASLARAQFNPVQLTPGSYTENIVVGANVVQDSSDTINVTAGNGVGLGDFTFFEQGLYSRPGTLGGNIGVPLHSSIFTDINNANIQFQMPPDYSDTNNDGNELMIDSATFPSGTLAFSTPTTATNLAILCTSGGGSITVNYTVTHSDTTTETGTLTVADWFTGGSTVAWGANGRIAQNGGYGNINTSAVNNNPPYLYALNIAVSGASPIVSIAFNWSSGTGHGNFYAVSGNAAGALWSPIPLDPSSFLVSGSPILGIVPAAIPFPVTATMDQGTNLVFNGNLATWYEQGYDRALSSSGLPPSGSTLTSASQPTHIYQMGNYSTNNAILIDTNHLKANIVLAPPSNTSNYTALAFLTAGGNEGAGNIMTNIAVIQRQDGVNETNLFFGYDWFDQNYPGAIAFRANGRVNLANRTLNAIGSPNFPFLFESYFLLNDTNSPVTNIVVLYKSAPNASATTYIMAVRAASGGVPPVVSTGPVPPTQTVFPGTNATFAVGLTGTQPIGGYWEVENNGVYSPLTDGPDANGSTIIGSHTLTLTISNVFRADGTNYQFIATNAFGSATSPVGTLIVSPQTISISPANPVFYTGNNFPLTAVLSPGPAVSLQWYSIDTSMTSNSIPGANGVTYTIQNATTALNGYTYGVIAQNIYGTNIASVVVAVSNSAAFLAADLSPTNAEAYVGAPVTFAVNARGNSPIMYQWLTNGVVVGGASTSSYTLATPCGTNTIQAAVSNSLNSGWVYTSTAVLKGDATPASITFNGNGTGWQTNTAGAGNVGIIANNALTLTDGGGGEASSAFYNTAQFIAGDWTASYTYNSHGGAADGTCFVLQNGTNAMALGGGGGQLGYTGIGNSLAFQINLYNGNNETPGINLATNGNTGIYYSMGTNVDVNGTNDINVKLVWNHTSGILSATLTDAVTGGSYSTNYALGTLIPPLGGNLAYVGFCGGDGGATSLQTVSNFVFSAVLPPVALSVSPVVNNSFVLSWPAADPNYVLQMSPSLSSPSWSAGPVPVNNNGTNQVTINVTSGGGVQFYRLLRIVCQ